MCSLADSDEACSRHGTWRYCEAFLCCSDNHQASFGLTAVVAAAASEAAAVDDVVDAAAAAAVSLGSRWMGAWVTDGVASDSAHWGPWT